MELDAVQGEGVDAGNVFQQGLPRFARQPQDEMAANRDTPLGGFPNGPFRTGEIVPAMYAQQGPSGAGTPPPGANPEPPPNNGGASKGGDDVVDADFTMK